MKTFYLIQNILSGYNQLQIRKVKDFLISKIHGDTLQEAIDFIKSSNMEKKKNSAIFCAMEIDIVRYLLKEISV